MDEMDTWAAYQRKVLSDLDRLETGLNEVKRSLIIMSDNISTLNVKSGVWGLLGGFVTVVIAIVIALIKNVK